MRKTHSKRTLHDILHYIRTKNQDGLLKESMNTIASYTGYSNATVHRALQALNENGRIQLIPPAHKRDSQTIRYMGIDDDQVSDILRKAQVAVTRLDEATSDIKEIMFEMRSMMALAELQRFNESYIEIN